MDEQSGREMGRLDHSTDPPRSFAYRCSTPEALFLVKEPIFSMAVGMLLCMSDAFLHWLNIEQ
jgi:hypothetical protein